MHYEFEFQMTEADFLDYNEFHFNNTPRAKLLMAALTVIPLLTGAAVFWIVFYLLGSSSFVFLPAVITVVLLSVMVYQLIFLSRTHRRNVKKQLKAMSTQGKLPYAENIRMQFDDEFIREFNERGETKTLYSSVDKIGEGKGVYIYTNAVQAYAIPLSAFESEEQRKNFITFMNAKINKAGKMST
ncbi:MAG: YcxB family protein [Defluviitaleaceae bacterium]|nr:YcxB family protein [Defluviitaleaceae bacterium]